MHAKARQCVLFMWIHVLALVLSEDCFLRDFKASPRYDNNFDTANLEEEYPNQKQVRVTCVVGYTGFFKMTCEGGTWSYKGDKCEPRSCGHPGDAQFADFRLDVGQDFVFGSQVVYTCHTGYQMVSRKNSRRCLAQGWDGVVPVCEALQCPVIRPDNNVQVYGDAEEANYGNVVRFSCKSNRDMLKGPAEIYCNEQGEWSGAIPKCEAIKCAVPEIENGRVLGAVREYRENDVLEYECNPGYRRTDSRLITCTKVGSTADWSPTPVCERIKCTVPLGPVEGTTYDPPYQNVFYPGDTLTVNCEVSHWIWSKQSTSVVTTCNDEGEWTVNPTCNAVVCENRRPDTVYDWGVRWGQQIRLGFTTRYRCRSGYKSTVQPSVAECTRDGWRPDPLCQEKTCDRIEIDNAVIRGNKQQYRINERATYVCNDGYEGNPVRVCKDSGWSGQSRCEAKGCPRPDITDANIQGNQWNSYRDGDKVQYVCASNSDLSFTITCMKGNWEGIHDCSGCPKPNLPNGFVIYTQNKIHYACREGYKLSTKGWWGEATCKDDVWDGFDEQCIENTRCGTPPQILNGEITHQRSVNEDRSSVDIDCEEGFLPQVRNLICEKGEWSSGGIPFTDICTPDPQNCVAPPKIANAVVLTPYQKQYLHDSNVTYECRATYNQERNNIQTIRCISGDWEKSDLTCTPPGTEI